MMRTNKMKRTAPLYRPLKLELPWTRELLAQHGLISRDADGVKVLRVIDRLLRVPVIVKGRALGFPVSQILAGLSQRSLSGIRKKFSRVRQ